ncbi:hypothetical protein AB1398_01680, partial [Hydrogenibacillus schlegelii]
VIGLEAVPEAVRDAEENARRNGIENARFLAGAAEDLLARFAGKERPWTSSSSTRRGRDSIRRRSTRSSVFGPAARLRLLQSQHPRPGRPPLCRRRV